MGNAHLKGLFMTETTTESLRVVAFREGDQWVAQCLEYDIQAQGSSFQCATRRLRGAVTSEMRYTHDKFGAPFEGIDPAPELYHDLFNSADQPMQADDNVEMRIAA